MKIINLKKLGIFTQITKVFTLIGAENDQVLFTWRLFFTCYLAGICGSMEIVYGFYLSMPDFVQICHALLILPLVCCCYAKFLARHVQKDMVFYNKCSNFACQFYEKTEVNPKYFQMLLQHSKRMEFLSKIYIGTQLWAVFCSIGLAWVLSIYNRDFVYLAFMILPLTDPNTLTGFLINQILMTIQTIATFLTLSTAEVAYIAQTMSAVSMIEVLCCELQEIVENLENSQNQHIEETFMKIIKKFQEYNIFVQNMNKAKGIFPFAIICFSSIGIGLSIIISIKYSLLIGLAMAVFMLFQVTFTCINGAILTIQKKKLLKELCGFPWYEMSPNMQKNFFIFIHYCQNSNEMNFPFFGVIDLEVLMRVINACYSYLMFLLHFLEF